VVLVDGSRSMGSLAPPPLQMAVALTSVSPDTETFTFSTELRRVTRDPRRAAAAERRPLHLRHAWGGGTTIGVCVDEFLRRFAERALGRQTVVIIASDGLDVGDTDLLWTSMETLARHVAAIIWLNLLAATAGYEPTARGMRLARPFVPVLAPANDPAGLLKKLPTGFASADNQSRISANAGEMFGHCSAVDGNRLGRAVGLSERGRATKARRHPLSTRCASERYHPPNRCVHGRCGLFNTQTPAAASAE
jgi:hypothetical protein